MAQMTQCDGCGMVATNDRQLMGWVHIERVGSIIRVDVPIMVGDYCAVCVQRMSAALPPRDIRTRPLDISPWTQQDTIAEIRAIEDRQAAGCTCLTAVCSCGTVG